MVVLVKPLRSTYPPTHLCNPAFRYTPSDKTDLRSTFRRVRKAQEALREASGVIPSTRPAKSSEGL